MTEVKEYLDQKFDSHALIACVENIDKAALSIDKDEETAMEDKEDDLATEEAVECAQTTTVEEDCAPNAGVEITDETTWGVDEEEEIAAMAKAADLVAEEDKELAQTMNVEVDTTTAANASTKIIDKDGITTAAAEKTDDVLHLKSGESKEESYARLYNYIRTTKDGWTHRDWRIWAEDQHNQIWRQRRNRRRHKAKMRDGRPQSKLR